LASRGTAWAGALTRLLLRTRVTPNVISVTGVLISAAGSAAILWAPQWPLLFLLFAAAIQLRLLCNLMDGLVAVEGGRGSKLGPLYNEFPDRIEDSLFLAAAGQASGMLWLGLTAALLAAITAYLRTLGGSLGLPQDFSGPMAKQQRMAVLTLGAVAACIESFAAESRIALPVTLAVVAAGTLITMGRRTLRLADGLRTAP
jgi:phosphatidylglycerophosphate synthase